MSLPFSLLGFLSHFLGFLNFFMSFFNLSKSFSYFPFSFLLGFLVLSLYTLCSFLSFNYLFLIFI